MLSELREELRKTAYEMLQAGLVEGTDGNVSARDPETGYVAITPSGMSYDEITADDIVVVDVDHKVIWGENNPSSEVPMHTYVYKTRSDLHAVMHTHAWYATLFALASKPIPPVTFNLAANFGGEVPVARYARPGSDAMGPAMMEALGEGSGVLLANHGTICVAKTLPKVLSKAKALEEGAKLIYGAMALGNPQALPQEDIDWLVELVKSFEKQVG